MAVFQRGQKLVVIIPLGNVNVARRDSEAAIGADGFSVEVASSSDEKSKFACKAFQAAAIGLARAGMPRFQALNAARFYLAQDVGDFSPGNVERKRMRDYGNAA